MSSISGVPRRPVVLVILDGYGINPSKNYNAVQIADTPYLDDFFCRYPHTSISASGQAVGLPDGQMGNSEVGHLTLGAGKIIRQDICKIDQAISSSEIDNNETLLAALKRAKEKSRPLHLLGLVSDGGVHSHIRHLNALISICKQHHVKPVVHMITDGRDTAPKSALNYLPDLEKRLTDAGGGIASISGRYYMMDRDHRWERTEMAWRALIMGKGQRAVCASTAIKAAYHGGDTDEFIRPILLPMFEALSDDDSVLCFNFRKDRPRQIVSALSDPGFNGFDRGDMPLPHLTCMMPYNKADSFPYLFDPELPETTLGEVISTMGLAQFHCAETEKYPHVTYFFNGGRSSPYSGEKQLVIPSPNVATYDLKPEMSAREVADAVVRSMSFGRYGFIVVNFANGDMVGHTAKQDAVIKAVQVLDQEVSRILFAAESLDYSVILSADHGNCEEMVNPLSGEAHTQHTTYPVPCLIMDSENWRLSCNGGLSSIAPTVLQLMGIAKPDAMTGTSLLLESSPRVERPSELSPMDYLKGVA